MTEPIIPGDFQDGVCWVAMPDGRKRTPTPGECYAEIQRLHAIAASSRPTIEIRRNEDGTLDEIVASDAHVHLEQMHATWWWMRVETGGQTYVLSFTSDRPVKVMCERE